MSRLQITDAVARLRRTVAQRGLRHALGNVLRRVRSRDFSADTFVPPAWNGTHPFDDAGGVETSGYIHGSALATGHAHDRYSVAYYGSAPSLVTAMLQRWQTTEGTGPTDAYTFIDFGAGKGRVVLLASQLPFRTCVGVELSPALHATAVENTARWQAAGKAVSPIQNLCQDATSYVFPQTPCVIYLFNPFTAKVLSRLLDNVQAAFATRPGQVDILYVNAEFRDEFTARPGFQLLWEERVRMSDEDAAADLLYMADEHGNKPFGEPGQEPCSAWRFVGAEAGLP